ncbi:MAG: hypothetical protein MJ221_04200 [Bacilli bacterium]|nr:hypothetical protein [Bacilli bacterium]
MRRFRFLINLSILPLCLSSCGANPNNPHITKNGNLTYLSEITEENAYFNGSFEYVSQMIDSEDYFIFYLTSSECSHCVEFKNKMLDYVKETKASVIKMDIIKYNDDDTIGYTADFEKFYKTYGDYFFINGEVLTPQVYIAHGKNVATKVPSSRYSTSSMFKGAMNDYVYLDNVMTFSKASSYNEFIKNNKEVMTILLKREYLGSNDIYKYAIKDLIHVSKTQVALVEIDEFNETEFCELFKLESITSPLGYYQNGEEKENYTFTTNINEGKAFLNKYLK